MLRVLVINDDPLVSDTMKAALQEYSSAEVVCCSSSAEARELMRSMRFDAILLDAFLPGITGLDLAEQAADLNIPLLMMTGHPELAMRYHEHGMPLLAKPFLPTDLVEQVIKIIRAAQENIAQVRVALAALRETATSARSAPSKTASGGR